MKIDFNIQNKLVLEKIGLEKEIFILVFNPFNPFNALAIYQWTYDAANHFVWPCGPSIIRWS